MTFTCESPIDCPHATCCRPGDAGGCSLSAYYCLLQGTQAQGAVPCVPATACCRGRRGLFPACLLLPAVGGAGGCSLRACYCLLRRRGLFPACLLLPATACCRGRSGLFPECLWQHLPPTHYCLLLPAIACYCLLLPNTACYFLVQVTQATAQCSRRLGSATAPSTSAQYPLAHTSHAGEVRGVAALLSACVGEGRGGGGVGAQGRHRLSKQQRCIPIPPPSSL